MKQKSIYKTCQSSAKIHSRAEFIIELNVETKSNWIIRYECFIGLFACKLLTDAHCTRTQDYNVFLIRS